ncbi:MAG: sulfatase-like hydrolase/transferase, partial [Lentisphaeria bacterium]|nr:sulfatase-like hydrolase/transferase [Lentisphaeria bacterium]
MPQPKEPEKPKLILTLLPGISFAAALLCPLGLIYLNNKGQFTLNTSTAFLWFLFLMGIITLLCAAPLALCRKRPAVYSVLNAVFLSLAATILLHQQFWTEIFPNDIFILSFSRDTIFLAVFHLILLLAPVAAAIRFRESVLKRTGKITSVIVLLVLTSLAGPVFSKPAAENYDFKNYALLENDKFTVASDRNIIIVVVDCMGERIIKEVLRKFPEMQQVLKDFTCFDNMVSPLPRTMYAVPAMLTGIDFPREKNGEASQDADHAKYVSSAFKTEKALFTLCRKQGWRREAYPFMLSEISYSPESIDNSMEINNEVKKQSVMKILDTALDKYTPFYLKNLLKEYYYIATDPFVQPSQEVNQTPEDVFDRVFFRRLNQEFKVGRYARGLKYYHLQGAHEAIRTDEKLAMNAHTLKYRQLRGSLKNVEVLLQKLKKAGLYDRATIIVTGDHSERYTPEIAAFIKRPGESHDHLVFNSIPCQVSDLCGTISRIGGLDPDAVSLFDRPPLQGSLNRIRGSLAAMLDFPGWQPAGKALGASEVLDAVPIILDHENLIIDMGNLRFTGLKSIAMTAENLETGKIYRTGMDMHRTANYT